jgi:two-component system OmpR family response regulator
MSSTSRFCPRPTASRDGGPAPSVRILLVEDDPLLRKSLAQALREEGYSVDTAETGDEGLYKIENTDYDAVVLDVMLPVLDGWTVLDRVRRSKTTPVLMLTARDSGRDRVRGLDGGADDYLVKPFDLMELFARLRAIIRRSAGLAHPVIALGDVTIDLKAKTVQQAGTTVNLTPREYSILEYMALHRGAVVTRTTLYEHIFDEDDDSLSNLLDVHVSSLRKKLGADLIVTRRGQGFCIER